MNAATVGIVVGVAVALVSQLISFLFDNLKKKLKECQQKKTVLTLLYHELAYHQGRYERLIQWAEEKIAQEGPEHEGYSYTPIQTIAYEKVYLAYWHLLPHGIVEPLIGYYEAVSHVNALSGSFSAPTTVPIERTKKIIEGVQHRANDLRQMLEKYIPAKKKAP